VRFAGGRAKLRFSTPRQEIFKPMIIIPSVSLATLDDARGIAEMSRDYIEFGLGWSWTPARVQKAIRDSSTNVAVVREKSDVLGFGIMRYGEQRAHLTLLAVLPGQRKRGLGAVLVQWLEKSAAIAGLERVQLEARADNPGAIAFYRDQGYEPAGTQPGYYRGEVDAVRLEKSLWISQKREPGA
jgi:[ribosomal protein S18]-alanine N-acetyltransferase